MITEWNHILSAAIQALSPMHRDLVNDTINSPQKRQQHYYRDAKKKWSMEQEQLDREFQYALDTLRLFLNQHGLTAPGDLELR